MTKPIPEGYHSVTPLSDRRRRRSAIDFYTKAFGAKEKFRLPMGDKIGHAGIRMGAGLLLFAEEFPDMGHLGPKNRGGTTVSLVIYVQDVDTAFQKAITGGAKELSRCRTSSGATAWALSPTRSATSGAWRHA